MQRGLVARAAAARCAVVMLVIVVVAAAAAGAAAAAVAARVRHVRERAYEPADGARRPVEVVAKC